MGVGGSVWSALAIFPFGGATGKVLACCRPPPKLWDIQWGYFWLFWKAWGWGIKGVVSTLPGTRVHWPFPWRLTFPNLVPSEHVGLPILSLQAGRESSGPGANRGGAIHAQPPGASFYLARPSRLWGRCSGDACPRRWALGSGVSAAHTGPPRALGPRRRSLLLPRPAARTEPPSEGRGARLPAGNKNHGLHFSRVVGRHLCTQPSAHGGPRRLGGLAAQSTASHPLRGEGGPQKWEGAGFEESRVGLLPVFLALAFIGGAGLRWAGGRGGILSGRGKRLERLLAKAGPWGVWGLRLHLSPPGPAQTRGPRGRLSIGPGSAVPRGMPAVGT